MTIVIIAEGKTEAALRQALPDFLAARCRREDRPRVETQEVHGTMISPKATRKVKAALDRPDVACVVALTDVYPEHSDAAMARRALREHLPDDARVHAHCALHDFEAWLLPYWQKVYGRAGVHAPRENPWPSPERVDLNKPPSHVLKELYSRRGRYRKALEAKAILEGEDLTVAAEACPELKALLDTILDCAGLALLD